MKFKVGLQMYSVREQSQEDLAGVLRAVKEMGYDGVEFAGLYDHSPEEVRDLCREIGLEPISAHVPFSVLRKDPEQAVADYANIGCKYIAIPFLNSGDRPGTPGWEKTIVDAEIIGKAASEKGLTLLYHNHDFEFVTVGGKYALDILYDTVPAKFLQTELDTCWVSVGGENPADYIRKYSGRAPIVHLKDYFGEKSEDMYELIGIESKRPKRPSGFELRPVGSGVQNFPEILKAAEEAGSEWVIVEQDNPSLGLTPMECAAKSREYLRSLGL